MEGKHIGHEIRILNNQIRRYVSKSCSDILEDESTPIHGWIICYLMKNKDRNVFQKDIENEFQIRRSTASNILNNMESKGYIERKEVKEDARLKSIVLTDKAIKINSELKENIKQNERIFSKDISKEDLDTFFRVIDMIKDNLEG